MKTQFFVNSESQEEKAFDEDFEAPDKQFSSDDYNSYCLITIL